jgi:hypothetical protein
MPVLEQEARYELVESAGEVRLQLFAPDVPQLFVEAVRAVAELAGADLAAPVSGPTETLHLRAADQEALLVQWVSALGRRAEKTGRVITALALDRLTEHDLIARVHSQPVGRRLKHIRAARFQRRVLTLEPRQGCRATITLVP